MPREFMSQSASICLLCLASGWVIIHANGCPDKTELGGSNPLNCVSHVVLLFARPAAGSHDLLPSHRRIRKSKGEGKIKYVPQLGSL